MYMLFISVETVVVSPQSLLVLINCGFFLFFFPEKLVQKFVNFIDILKELALVSLVFFLIFFSVFVCFFVFVSYVGN